MSMQKGWTKKNITIVKTTACPVSSDPSYVVSYSMKGVTTSWTFIGRYRYEDPDPGLWTHCLDKPFYPHQ